MGCGSSKVPASQPSVIYADPQSTFHNLYEVSSKLGKGAYGQVHLATKRCDQDMASFAVKIRNLHRADTLKTRDPKACLHTYKEVSICNRVGSHRHCVRMYDSFFDDHLCYMVMERCSNTLSYHVAGMPDMNENTLSLLFAQMLKGIAHIHSVRIVHRDIKPDNFLVSGHIDPIVKLADFGSSDYVPEGEGVHGVCGTAAYMCPEMIKTRQCDLKADVWSFGVVAYLLLCGIFPYMCRDGGSKSMKLSISEGRAPRFDKPWLSRATVSLLKATLQRDFHLRPTASEVLEMPYIVSGANLERDPVDLRTMFHSAAKTGAFETPDLGHTSVVDMMLKAMQRGVYESTVRTLTQSDIDDFIFASDQKRKDLVDAFWSARTVDEDWESSDSTSYKSSGVSFTSVSEFSEAFSRISA